jgi:hypothetical protein
MIQNVVVIDYGFSNMAHRRISGRTYITVNNIESMIGTVKVMIYNNKAGECFAGVCIDNDHHLLPG